MKKVVMCISLVLLGLILTGQSFAKVTLDDAMAIWLFDEGQGNIAGDSSGNDNNGELLNGPKWVDGKFGKALDFDGEDDLVRVNFPDITLTSWTVVAWIYPRNPSAGHYQGIIQAWPNQGEFQIQSNSGAIGIHPIYGGSLSANEWMHVAGIVKDNHAQIYINGESVVEGEVKAVTFSKVGLGDLYDCPAGFNYKFDGIMDDAGVFNIALTEDDIKEVMTKGIGQVLGIAAVSQEGKIATTWGKIKSCE